ncbi:unnamed protein product [Cyprideis torosa]|uniref:Uncharacterized protein n=1 Tax=Cyprideis torosa TaxID=163714 RepID=A0A7R8ZSM9_9CRUS|nr:unnamed protein product [Cyprideis torosa]CAG0895884.1 unnamed protein product [Cyprideis torosa]
MASRSECRRPVFKFVSPPPEDFVCSICTEVLFDPVEISVPDCEHLYCRPCITEWISTNPKCPECQRLATTSSLKEPNRRIRSFLDSLQVYCPLKGCSAKVKAEELERHIEKCKSSSTICTRGCDQEIRINDLQKHDCLDTLKTLLVIEVAKNLSLQEEKLQKNNSVIQDLERQNCSLKKEVKDTLAAVELKQSEINILKSQLRERDSLVEQLRNKITDLNNRCKEHEAKLARDGQRQEAVTQGLHQQVQTPSVRNELPSDVAHGAAAATPQPGTSSATAEDELQWSPSEDGIFQFSCQLEVNSNLQSGGEVWSPVLRKDGFTWRVVAKKTSGGYLGLFLLCQKADQMLQVAWKVGFEISLLRRGWPKWRTFRQYAEMFTSSSPVHGFPEFCNFNKRSSFTVDLLQIEVVVFTWSFLWKLPNELQTSPIDQTYVFKRVSSMEGNDETYSPRLDCLFREWKLRLKKIQGNPYQGSIAIVAQSDAENDWLDGAQITLTLKAKDSQCYFDSVWDFDFEDGDNCLVGKFDDWDEFENKFMDANGTVKVEVRVVLGDYSDSDSDD